MDPRGSRAETAACMARLAVQLSAARGRLVLGDPFSRLIQALLPFSRARELVVVDDGTATLELAELLLSEAPLVRWHAGGRGGGRFARKAGEILLARPFELFTAMSGPVPLPGNAVLTANRYAWARRRFGAPTVRQGTVDLAGTSSSRPGSCPRTATSRASPNCAGPPGSPATWRTAGSVPRSWPGSPRRPGWTSSGPDSRSNWPR
ncbi:hypothetical protein ACFQZC_24855 [Streptacidiphilus monticola]